MTNKTPSGARKHHKSKSTNPRTRKTGQLFFFLLSSFFRRSRTATVKILQDLFAAEVGVGMTMAAFGRNKSMTEKVASWTPGVL